MDRMVGPTPDVRAIDPDAVGVFEVLPGLWSVRVPLVWPGISHVNVVVVENEGPGVMLVDCGTAGDETCWEALVHGLDGTGHAMEDVTDLVVTHAHSDHFGLAARVVAESGCTMWMHPAHEAFTDAARDPGRIHAARGRRARAEGVPEEALPMYADTGEETDFALWPLPAFRELHAGMELPSGLGPWEVLETPGHSPSHVSLYQRERRLLLLGDLVSRIFAPWYDYGYTADPVAELSGSLDLIAELDVELALPGHGRPISGEDLTGIIAMHRHEIAHRLELVEAEVAREPGPAYEIGLRAFGPESTGMAEVGRLQEAMACLRHLRLQGRVQREELPSGIFRWSPV
jgi:glyoxylase-like metal-dependent hydrolase (beta-lactamase superfamily II)